MHCVLGQHSRRHGTYRALRNALDGCQALALGANVRQRVGGLGKQDAREQLLQRVVHAVLVQVRARGSFCVHLAAGLQQEGTAAAAGVGVGVWA